MDPEPKQTMSHGNTLNNITCNILFYRLAFEGVHGKLTVNLQKGLQHGQLMAAESK